jgi:hypothetical protein
MSSIAAPQNRVAESFTIATGHPRVLVRSEDLPILSQRAATTHAREMQALRTLAAAPLDPTACADHSDVLWRLSFLCLVSNESAHGAKAIEALHKVLALHVSGEYFTGARRLKALAAAYDWMHDFLDEDLRRRVGLRALEYCQALYDSGEVEPGCYLLGHAINQMPFILMAAIAIGDEIEGARWFLNDTMRLMQLQVPCYRHFLEQDCLQQSFSYTSTYVGEFPYLFHAIE